MSHEHEHPGTILASVLKEKAIDPLDLAERTHLSYARVTKILDGEEDITSIDSLLIENSIGGDQPAKWFGHQQAHNAWKKTQR